MNKDRFELVLASALMLFTELVLIRWTGANVVYLSYFSNFVLLGSFLGIGIGFLRAHKGPDLFRWAPVLLAFFAAFVTIFPVSIDRSGSDLIFFGALEERGLPAWLMLPVIFIAVAATMTAIAHGVATRFARFEALEAYRLDILGSFLGIVAFAGFAYVSSPPVVWAVPISLAFLALLPRSGRAMGLTAITALIVVFAVGSLGTSTVWSPYYRITYETARDTAHGDIYSVSVNGIPHQAFLSAASRRDLEPYYFVPYERTADTAPGDVLIIGAGTGSDVAIALAQGAARVDAVEIDPELFAIGERLHPDRPYQDGRVEAALTDGRAFLENTQRTYDLILFALPDSLTLVSGQSALRLESYLFTREAFVAAKERLSPDGALALYNFYRERWLVDRLAGTLASVFGAPPCIDLFRLASQDIGSFSVMTAGVNGTGIRCDTTWRPTGHVVEPATDDHPFVYLQERGIPLRYGIVLVLILATSLLAVRLAGGRFGAMRRSIDLFFMGAAFLLLETLYVVRFALLFGTTWFVNALVFAGILLTVLAAVEVERRVRIGRPGLLFVLLFASIGISLLVPTTFLLGLPFAARFVVACALAFAPIFVANLVFAGRFRDAVDPAAAFGANLLGAMVGGVVEYASLVTGHRALLLLAAVFYALAWVFGRRRILARPLPDTQHGRVSVA